MDDTISRRDAINAVHKAGITEYDETLAIEEIERVPSAQPDVPDINDGDMISRRAVQEMIDRIGGMYPYRQIGNRDSYSQYNEAWTDAINQVDAELSSLPSVQRDTDEWCVTCKEYDSEHHCCPRWNRVIRETLKEAQPEVIRCKDCKHWGEKGLCGKWDQYISNGDFYCGCAETMWRREQ